VIGEQQALARRRTMASKKPRTRPESSQSGDLATDATVHLPPGRTADAVAPAAEVDEEEPRVAAIGPAARA